MVKQAYLGLFLIFQVASSIYLFGPGMPQPADLLMAVLIIVLATGFIIKPALHKDLVFFGALFVGYGALVNLFWYGHYQMKSFWLSPFYYAFNFGTMMVVISLIRTFRERLIIPWQVAIAVAVVVEVVAVLTLSRSAFRSIGTFNNPNQLGYWALVLGCCWLVLKRDQRLTVVDFVVLCGIGYLAATSLSKAAMVAFMLLLVMGLAVQRLTRGAKVLFLILGLAGTATVVLDSSAMERLLSVGIVERVTERLDDVGGQADDSLRGRGYDRIWQHPQYLVFGAGEGATDRFSPEFNPHQTQKEMHSTFGTVLFSYGIIGFGLFIALLTMVFRQAALAHLLYSLPIWAYGITHQGLRDTVLWVFLGTVFGLAHYARSASRPPVAAAPTPPPLRLTPRGPRATAGRPAIDPVALGAREARGSVR